MFEMNECVGLDNCIRRYNEAVAILGAAGFGDYHVADLYNNGFTAKLLHTGEMIAVEIVKHLDHITIDNIDEFADSIRYVILHN